MLFKCVRNIRQYCKMSTTATTPHTTIQQQKKQLRSQLKHTVQQLSHDTIQYESNNVIQQLLYSNEYSQCTALCCYISMQYELQTHTLIHHALQQNKRIYVPYIDMTDKSNTMYMYQLYSIDDYNTLPTNAYGIKQPHSTYVHNNTTIQRNNAINDSECTVMIVPGVAFQIDAGSRLGHGKGYYDKYITQLQKLRPVTTIGVALSCQCVEYVPIDEHDVKLNKILYPKG